jgi:hypothetical protein
MQQSNATLTFLDTTINRSVDLISTSLNQLLQLVFCLLGVFTLARLINYFVLSKSQPETDATTEVPKEEPKVPVKAENEVPKEEEEEKEEAKPKKPETSGWESESLADAPQPQLEVSQKVIKHQMKIPRRKCMSVGPVMLTPNSQIIRKVNVEEREERYRYDILPFNVSGSSNNNTESNISAQLTPQSSVDITDLCVKMNISTT